MEGLNANYGTMVAALLYCKKFAKSLVNHGLQGNPYDECVANMMNKGKQNTVCFHIDDSKFSHEQPQVVGETFNWLRKEYECKFSDGTVAMNVHRDNVHKYIGMTLDFSHKGQCIVTMLNYLDGTLKVYDEAMDKYGAFLSIARQCYETPAPANLFTVNKDCEKLPKDMATDFHTIISSTLYVSKRARSDMCLSIAFLTARVQREALTPNGIFEER